jgi:hypothetical protein
LRSVTRAQRRRISGRAILVAIQEIGIADARLTRSRQAARRFFRSFD